MSKSMKALVLAGVLSIAAASAVQAGGHVTGGDFRGHANMAPAGGTARSGQIPRFWHPVLAGGKPTGMDFHASAAPACGEQCPVLATEGAPGSPGDNNGRSSARVADDGPVSAGDHNGRSAALSQGGGKFLVASIKGGSTGDF